MRVPLRSTGLIVLLLALTPMLFTFYTVESGTVGVLATFGKYSESVDLPGLHFKIPSVQSVTLFDVRLQTINYRGVKDQPQGDGIINYPHIQVLDNKSLPVTMDLSVQLTPHADKAPAILTNYGTNYMDRLINPIIRNVARDVVGKYQAEQIADKRSEIGKELETSLAAALERYPFDVNNIALRDIGLPEVVQKKIEEVQLAKQEEQRLGMIEQQARRNQEIKTIEANTRLIEITTEARAAAERRRIEAEAAAFQITKEAEATAAANKLIAQSITADLIRYKAIQQWNGQYPQTLLGDAGKDVILALPQGGK